MEATPLDIPLDNLDVEFEVSFDDWEISPGKQHHRHPRNSAIVSFLGSARTIHPFYLEEFRIKPEQGKQCRVYTHLSFGRAGGAADSTPSDSEAFMGSLEVVNLGPLRLDEEPRGALCFDLRASLPWEDLAPILAIRGDKILVKLSMWGEEGKAYGQRLQGGGLHIKVRWITLSRIGEGEGWT
jgi:hypothetical protein